MEATKIKLTPIPAELKAAVREALLAARDIMNNDGTHWVQGEYKMPLLVPTGQLNDYGQPIMQEVEGAFMWCAVGGIQEVTRIEGIQAYSMIALAERGGILSDVDRERLEYVYEDRLAYAQNSWDYYSKQEDRYGPQSTARPVERADIIDTLAPEVQDFVTGWNDRPTTTWDDVSAAFTKAAESLG